MTPLCWNANILDREGPRTRSAFFGGWMNRFTESGQLAPIDATFRGRRHDASAWRVELPALATGELALVSAPLWSPVCGGHRQTHAAFSIRAVGARPVFANDVSPNEVTYRDAFGEGIHLTYAIHHRRAVEIERRMTLDRGAAAVHGAISFDFVIRTPSNVTLRPVSHLALHRSPLRFQYGSGEHDGFGIKPAIAWDDFGHRVPVEITVELQAPGVFRLRKTLTETNARKLIGRIYLDDTLTVYPDTGTGSTTVDGNLQRTAAADSWAAMRGGAGTAHADTGTSGPAFQITGSMGGTTFTALYRSIYTFDTSALTAGATVTAAVFSVYGSSKADGGAGISPILVTVTATPASNNDLVDGDFSQLGSTAISDTISYASLSTSGYNALTLSDLSQVSQTGITKLGLREHTYDRGNTQPNFGMGGGTSQFTCYFADNGSNKPKLVVTYTAAGGGGRGNFGGDWLRDGMGGGYSIVPRLNGGL